MRVVYVTFLAKIAGRMLQTCSVLACTTDFATAIPKLNEFDLAVARQ